MKVKVSTVLTIFFYIKILTDFFSPFREFNIILQAIFVLPLILRRDFIPFIIKNHFHWVVLYLFFYFFVNPSVHAVKVFSSIIFFCALCYGGYKVRLQKIYSMSRKIWSTGILIFFSGLILSYITGLYVKREFYNFEHVNLLGTYVVLLSTFYFLSIQNLSTVIAHPNSNSFYSKFLPVTAAALTLSTGSLITQLSSYLPKKYFKKKNIFKLLFFLILSVIILFSVTKYFFYDLHTKIFGSFIYFTQDITLEEFYTASISQNLDLNSSQNSGSFTWRIYAYVFYLHHFFTQDLVFILFGTGIYSFIRFADFAPHNDFIAIMLDFGILGLFLILWWIYKLLKQGLKVKMYVLVTFLVFIILRFSFENVIYSSYLLSFLTSIGGLLYGILLTRK